MTPVLAAALAALSSAASALGCGDLECGWAETWDVKDKPPLCEAAARGSARPQCVYEGDHAKDVQETFKKLHKESGLPALPLVHHRDPAHADCAGGGGMAVSDAKGRPVRLVICDNLFDSTRNIHQLAAVMGHELSHLVHKHGLREDKACRAMLSAWKKAQGKAYLKKRPAAAQKRDAEAALCQRLNQVSRRHERQADTSGLRLARKAGYEPKEAAKIYWQDRDLVWAESGRESATTHPSATRRAKDLEAEAGTGEEKP